MSATKPFVIDKRLVYEAYKAVKANAGAAGVDKQSIEEFEQDLKDNLYKLWNRMSSGSYFPPPVKAVAIEKRMAGSASWAYLRWQIEWRRWSSNRSLNRR